MRRRIRKKHLLRGLIVLALLLALPLAWNWTLLNHGIGFETLLAWQQSIKHYPGAFFLVLGAYLIGSLVLFPVTVLNIATVLTFGPVLGNVYGVAGWLLSGSMGYGLGRLMGHELLHKMAGPRLDRLIHQAGRHGFLTVLTMRVLPVAPFTLVNLFVGASGIRFRDFFLASLVGRIPGIVVLTLAGVQLEYAMQSPQLWNFALIGLILILAPLATLWLSRRARLRTGARAEPDKSRPAKNL